MLSSHRFARSLARFRHHRRWRKGTSIIKVESERGEKNPFLLLSLLLDNVKNKRTLFSTTTGNSSLKYYNVAISLLIIMVVLEIKFFFISKFIY